MRLSDLTIQEQYDAKVPQLSKKTELLEKAYDEIEEKFESVLDSLELSKHGKTIASDDDVQNAIYKAIEKQILAKVKIN